MSIVALKRKTQAKYNNMSVGQPNFSLNGTHRSQGFIGQTSLSRSLPRTLMKGATPRGHGGCCGKYPIGNIIQSAVTSTEDPTIIKNSVLDTNALLIDRHKLTRVDSNSLSTVKPDATQNLNSQSSYINHISTKMTSCALLNNKNKAPLQVNNSCLKGIINVPSGYKSYTKKSYCQHFKPTVKSTNLPLSQHMSEESYILNKKKQCIENDKFTIPKSTNGEPFAC
jgi:hypothetical protein